MNVFKTILFIIFFLVSVMADESSNIEMEALKVKMEKRLKSIEENIGRLRKENEALKVLVDKKNTALKSLVQAEYFTFMKLEDKSANNIEGKLGNITVIMEEPNTLLKSNKNSSLLKKDIHLFPGRMKQGFVQLWSGELEDEISVTFSKNGNATEIEDPIFSIETSDAKIQFDGIEEEKILVLNGDIKFKKSHFHLERVTIQIKGKHRSLNLKIMHKSGQKKSHFIHFQIGMLNGFSQKLAIFSKMWGWGNSGIFNDNFYAVITKEKLTWENAKKHCEGIGGHLVTITSEEENEFIGTLLGSDDDGYWIGLSDKGRTNNDFEWVDGDKSSFRKWNKSVKVQPDNANGKEFFVEIGGKHGPGNTWNDHSEIYKNYFICEWKMK